MGHLDEAHKLLCANAQAVRKRLVNDLESGSRNFFLMRDALERYVTFLRAADHVADQLPPVLDAVQLEKMKWERDQFPIGGNVSGDAAVTELPPNVLGAGKS